MALISTIIIDGVAVSKSALRAWLDAPQMTGPLALGSAAIGTGQLTVLGGSLASIEGFHVSTTLAAGRLIASGGSNSKITALHGYSDNAAVELSVGSTSGYVTGFVARSRSFDGTAGEGAAIYVRSAVKLTVDSSGHFLPGGDNLQNFGSGSFRLAVVYAGTGTINTSDAREKQQIGAIEEALLDAWADVEWRRFKFNDAVEAKGENARWHFGAIAQQVRDAIDGTLGEGEAIRLGLICFDEWAATEAVAAVEPVEEVRDADDNVIVREQGGIPAQPGREAGNRWGLRYDECQAVEAAYQRRRMAAIEARLDALEA